MYYMRPICSQHNPTDHQSTHVTLSRHNGQLPTHSVLTSIRQRTTQENVMYIIFILYTLEKNIDFTIEASFQVPHPTPEKELDTT